MRHRRLSLLFALALLTTAANCDQCDPDVVTPITPPAFEVSGIFINGNRTVPLNPFSSAIAITNGTTEEVTVTVEIRRGSGFTGAVTENVSISGEGMNLETKSVTIPANQNSASVGFSLHCNEGGSPAGTVGNVHSASGANTRRGSRRCSSAPLGGLVGCVDDPLSLSAKFNESYSASVYLLCIPSVGPTQGTF